MYRELSGLKVDERRLVVGILPGGCVSVRLKGTRREVQAPAAWIFEAWARIERRAEIARRKRQRKEARIQAQIDMALSARKAR